MLANLFVKPLEKGTPKKIKNEINIKEANRNKVKSTLKHFSLHGTDKETVGGFLGGKCCYNQWHYQGPKRRVAVGWDVGWTTTTTEGAVRDRGITGKNNDNDDGHAEGC